MEVIKRVCVHYSRHFSLSERQWWQVQLTPELLLGCAQYLLAFSSCLWHSLLMIKRAPCLQDKMWMSSLGKSHMPTNTWISPDKDTGLFPLEESHRSYFLWERFKRNPDRWKHPLRHIICWQMIFSYFLLYKGHVRVLGIKYLVNSLMRI